MRTFWHAEREIDPDHPGTGFIHNLCTIRSASWHLAYHARLNLGPNTPFSRRHFPAAPRAVGRTSIWPDHASSAWATIFASVASKSARCSVG